MFRSLIQQNRWVFISLICLTALLFGLVMWDQPNSPAGFFRDEAGIGYSAYSLLKTGRDSWGRFLPLHVKALGDYPPAMYNYLTIPFIATMGLTELATRMAGIVAALVLVPLVYLFVHSLQKNQSLALLTVLVMITNPWFITQARSGSEPLVALALVLTGLLSWKAWNQTSQKKYFIVTLLVYFLALFTYNAVKPVLFLLHLLFGLFTTQGKGKVKQNLAWSGIILLFSFLSVFAFQGAADNYESGNIFKLVSERDRQVEFTREGIEGVPVIVSRILHNKVQDLWYTASGATLTYMDSGFLYFTGGRPTRYQIPYSGLLLLISFPLIIISLIEQKILKRKQIWFWLIWLVIGIIPGVVSINFHPHVKRTLFMFLPLFVFTAAGFLEVRRMFPKLKMISSALILMIGLYNLVFFLDVYFVHSRYTTVVGRSYGFGQGFAKLKELETNYDKVVVYASNESPETFYLFYNQIDPEYVQAKAAERSHMFDGIETSWQLNNYEFVEKDCPASDQLEDGVLYMSLGLCNQLIEQGSYQILDKVFMPDKSLSLMIFQKDPAWTETAR